jgi:hypothetical protein
MAAMNTFPRPAPREGFNHLESFKFPSVEQSLPVQPNGFYNLGAPFHVKPESIAEPTSPAPLTSELTTLSLRAPLCPLCKGQKYGFTAYFHNSKIFPEPPHELLALVEKSYVLKNRLKSLLVTYVMRELEHGNVQEAEKEVSVWSQLIEDLLSEVMASASDIELGLRPLDEVRNWTKRITRQVRDSVVRKQELEMPKGRLVVLLLEFRKLWEGVWNQCLLDRKNGSFLYKNAQIQRESQ